VLLFIGLQHKAHSVSHKIFMSLNFKTLKESVQQHQMTYLEMHR